MVGSSCWLPAAHALQLLVVKVKCRNFVETWKQEIRQNLQLRSSEDIYPVGFSHHTEDT